MMRVEVRCANCNRKLLHLLLEYTRNEIVRIEIKCPKNSCKAINIVDYKFPDKLVVRLKEDYTNKKAVKLSGGK